MDYVSSVRLTPKEREEVMEQLAEHEGEPGIEQRQHDRFHAPGEAQLPIEMQQPGGSVNRCKVVLCDLSSSGLGFLHGAYVHAGTACRIRLRATDGTIVLVRGTVVRCRHVRARVHEAGVRFREPIDVSRFITGAKATGPGNAPGAPPAGVFERIKRLAEDIARRANERESLETLRATATELVTACESSPAFAPPPPGPSEEQQPGATPGEAAA